tara:strand:+ start:2138 stop:5839 length:3702 start_codon:yes stop_codon:yes gene_type:complete
MGSMDQVVELQKTLPKLLKDMERLVKTSGGLFDESEIKKVQAINDEFQRLQSGMERAGKKGAVGFGRELQKINEALSASYSQLNELVAQRMEVERKRGKRALYYEDRRLSQQLKGIRELEAEQARNAAKALRDLKKFEMAQDRLNSNMAGTIFDPKVNPFNKDAITDVDQFAEYTEGKLSSLADTFSDTLSGNLDQLVSRGFALTKGSLKALDMKGAQLQAKGQQKGGGGMFSTFGMGKSLSKLAMGLKALAGVAAGAFAIFKIMQSLEEAVKEVNRDLIDTYGASDLLKQGMTDTYTEVNKIRESFADPDFAYALGVTLDDARKLTSEFNQLGISFGSLQDDGLSFIESMDTLKTMTISFQASAKAMGVDFGTLVGFTKEFRHELGLSVKDGRYLERMSQEFGRIRDMAKQSSLSTKDFFSVIQDLVGGISNMNLRVGEAVNIFTNLSKVLGPEAAQAFTKGLAGGFKGEGITDRFKRIILTGGMKGVMKRSADATKDDFFKSYGSLGGVGALKNRDLSKMGDKELEEIMGKLRREGGLEGQGAARKLLSLVRLSRGGKGGLSNQAMGMGELDMSGTLSATMKQLYNIQGEKGFQGITAIGMEKLVNMTGKSLEELEQMRLIDMAMRDDFRVLEEIKRDARGKDGRLNSEKTLKLLKERGLADKGFKVQGDKIVDKEGKVIDSIQDYIHSQGAAINKMGEGQMDELTLLAGIVDATMTSADRISNELKAMTQKLGDPLSFIASMTGDDKEREAREKRKRVAGELEAESGALSDEILSQKEKDRKENTGARLKISKIKDHQKRSLALAKQEEKERKQREAIEKMEEELKLKNEQRSVILSAEGRKIKGEDIKSQSEAMAKRKRVRTKSGRASLSNEEAMVAQVYNALEAQGISTQNRLPTLNNLNELVDKALKERVGQKGKGRLQQFEDAFRSVGGKDAQVGAKVGSYILAHGEQKGHDEPEVKVSELFAQIQDREGRQLKLDRSRGKQNIPLGNYSYLTSEERQKALGMKRLMRKGAYTDRRFKREESSVMSPGEAAAEKGAQELKYLNSQLSRAPDDKTKAEIQAKIQAKNKQLNDQLVKNQVKAIMEADKKKLQSQSESLFQNLRGNDFNTSQGRKAYIDAIDGKLADGSLSDVDRQMYASLRNQFRSYYAEDALSEPGSKAPTLLRAGQLIQGKESDTVAFFDRSKGGLGRGGMGGSTIINNYNINGNNPAAMLDTLKRANQSQGMLMG